MQNVNCCLSVLTLTAKRGLIIAATIGSLCKEAPTLVYQIAIELGFAEHDVDVVVNVTHPPSKLRPRVKRGRVLSQPMVEVLSAHVAWIHPGEALKKYKRVFLFLRRRLIGIVGSHGVQ